MPLNEPREPARQESGQKTSLISIETPGNPYRDRDLKVSSLSGKTRLKDHRTWTGLVLLLNICVVAFLIVIVFVPISLTSSGLLSGDLRTLYITGIALLANIYTMISIKCIRYLWLGRIDKKLCSAQNVAGVDPLWRNLMGVSTLKERLQQWEVTIILTICGLGTAAITGAMVPTITTRIEGYTYSTITDSGYYCTGPNATTPQNSLYWNLDNGSTYSLWPNMQFCPTSEALTLLGGINVLNPDAYGYVDDGVAVQRGALGAPASVYSSQTNYNLNQDSGLFLNDTLEKYGSSLLSTSQCVPVMVLNPVQCHAVTTNYASGFITVDAPSYCPLSLDTAGDTQVATKICTHGQVGEATIVIVTVQGISWFLREAMADYAIIQQFDEWNQAGVTVDATNTSYGVVCTVDTRDIFEYRQVELNLQQSPSNTGKYARSLGANRTCNRGASYEDMPDWDATRHMLPATAALAAWQLLYTGIIDTTRQFIIQPMAGDPPDHSVYVRKPPYAFSNSRNALEDVLGLTSALVAAHLSVTGDSPSLLTSGQATIAYSRIGTGHKWALLYTLPSLFNLGVLVFLFLTADAKMSELASSLQQLYRYFSTSSASLRQ